MPKKILDGSLLLVEGAVKAGVEYYSGYPITPANRIYFNSVDRVPYVLKAPDEITALQWASGVAAAGRLPMTGTSHAGFSLMVETFDMAFMMELPVVIMIAQRLGPSTGSATTGAQGDVSMFNRLTSGGYNVPVFTPSNLKDCYELAGKSVQVAAGYRTPVVLLTSKEMIQTKRSFEVDDLPELDRAKLEYFQGEDYLPYDPGDGLVPDFLSLGNGEHQVRMTASTHNKEGILSKADPESMENTARLNKKIEAGAEEFGYYELDEDVDAETLIVSYGITSYAAREALETLRENGHPTSLLLVKTLLPVAEEVKRILTSYSNVVIAEENLMGQYRRILYGEIEGPGVSAVNAIGHMISPSEIVREVKSGGI
ncbi:hypothetical protein KGY63_01545 [Candidatus Bipolaricaulota bacterium]|nr:hypothetical protein [Candidatus Bipolaricaulota bacterium]